MLLKEVLTKIEKILPTDSALEGDKIGLQIQSGIVNLNKILITLEVTKEVINEAIENKCDCIIAFHPLIYQPLQQITNENRVGDLAEKLIKNSIALIVVHTTFDSFKEGTSKILAKLLDLKVKDFLIANDNYDEKGMGVISEPLGDLTPNDLLKKVHKICNSPIRFSKDYNKSNIKEIAIVGGSGMSFLNTVLEKQIDAYITSDITYHRFHEVQNKVLLIDPGHYELEQFVPLALYKTLLEIFSNDNIDLIISKIHTNPVAYYPQTDNYKNLQKNYLNKNRNK